MIDSVRIAAVTALFFLFSVTQVVFSDASAWTAAGRIGIDERMSIFSYGLYGAGMFPYNYMLPGIETALSVDGVPQASVSPFGHNLERIPSLFVRNFDITGNDIVIFTPWADVREPVTHSSFFLGNRGESRFDILFERRLGPVSGIAVGGSYQGIPGATMAPGGTLRNYLVKYVRDLTGGGLLYVTANGASDNEDIFDITAAQRMGNRESDMIYAAVGVRDRPLIEGITVSPVVYYIQDETNFTRFGQRQGIDRNEYGFRVDITASRENAVYGFETEGSFFQFDTDIHGEDFMEYLAHAAVTGNWEFGRIELLSRVGTRAYGRYDVQPLLESEIRISASERYTWVISGTYAGAYPTIAQEFYTTPTFSSADAVSPMESYRYGNIEGGMEYSGERLSAGGFLFFARGAKPQFVPSPLPVMHTAESADYTGGRLYAGYTLFEGLDITGRLTVRDQLGVDDAQDTNLVWPYPSVEFLETMRYRTRIYNNRVIMNLFQSASVRQYEGGAFTPDGTYFIANAGVSATIGPITAFARIDNLTDERMQWFNTFNLRGRSTFWGIQFTLID